VAFALSIPFVFAITKTSQIDRFLGDLSYPIYVSHLLVIGAFAYYCGGVYHYVSYDYQRQITIVMVIAAAIVLNLAIRKCSNCRISCRCCLRYRTRDVSARAAPAVHRAKMGAAE
jgi:peptidoglycan/LPS O-acetylase OafA/YrhL